VPYQYSPPTTAGRPGGHTIWLNHSRSLRSHSLARRGRQRMGGDPSRRRVSHSRLGLDLKHFPRVDQLRPAQQGLYQTRNIAAPFRLCVPSMHAARLTPAAKPNDNQVNSYRTTYHVPRTPYHVPRTPYSVTCMRIGAYNQTVCRFVSPGTAGDGSSSRSGRSGFGVASKCKVRIWPLFVLLFCFCFGEVTQHPVVLRLFSNA